MRKAFAHRTMQAFTLVEMLVVVLIMGILVGTVGARLQPRDSDVLRVEAQRLAQLLELAGQEARLTGMAIVWTSDGVGYRFWRQGGDGGWSEIRDDDIMRARTLPQAMVLSGLRDEAGRPQPDMRLEFPTDGPLSAFSMDLSLGHEHYSVAASPTGDLHIMPGQETSHVDTAMR